MNLERAILIISWIASTAAIFIFVPRTKKFQFIFAYLVCQAITWINVTIHVKFHLLAYPVREFPKATDMGFTMQYWVYPILCGIYLVNEPRRSRIMRGLYLFCWTSGLTLFHIGQDRYTELLEYLHFHWIIAWVIFLLMFVMVKWIVNWFFASPPEEPAEEACHES